MIDSLNREIHLPVTRNHIDSFLRRITYQELTREGLRVLAPTVVAMARAEGLDAHAEAVRIRLEGGVR